MRKKLNKYYLLALVGIFLTILSGIFWDNIPLFITVGIYSKEAFWESFFININNMILDVAIIGFLITFLNKRKEKKIKIKIYLDKLDTYRKYYMDNMGKVSLETFLYLDKLYELGYNITDLNGNFFHNGRLSDKKFYKTELRGVNFIETRLDDIEFHNCVFRGNKFKKCLLKNITFKNNLNDEMKNVEFDDCKKLVNLNSTNGTYKKFVIKDSIVSKLYFQNIIFENIHLKDSKINSFEFIECTFINFSADNMIFNTGKFKDCIFKGKSTTRNIKLIKVKNAGFLKI